MFNLSLLLKAAEEGDSIAQMQLALHYFNSRYSEDQKKAVEWFWEAAKNGNTYAKRYLQHCYKWGIGVERDMRKAAKLGVEAAEEGNIEAQLDLAFATEKGGDYQDALEWYTKAAEQGDAYAQYALGIYYYLGKGGQQNQKKAFEWFLKAAEQGHLKAQFNISLCYYLGIGVEKDESKGSEWTNKALEQDDYEVTSKILNSEKQLFTKLSKNDRVTYKNRAQ